MLLDDVPARLLTHSDLEAMPGLMAFSQCSRNTIVLEIALRRFLALGSTYNGDAKLRRCAHYWTKPVSLTVDRPAASKRPSVAVPFLHRLLFTQPPTMTSACRARRAYIRVLAAPGQENASPTTAECFLPSLVPGSEQSSNRYTTRLSRNLWCRHHAKEVQATCPSLHRSFQRVPARRLPCSNLDFSTTEPRH